MKAIYVASWADIHEIELRAFMDSKKAMDWMQEHGYKHLLTVPLDEEIAPEQLELPGIPPF